ncbi:MAG TPA: Na+ dependent nucleoside transporter N-terminal domain-containing protein, partial [Steroidobacteraceae bacterium]|nr:Na+ dependent nucleoside transporter N-terminal domain-containing protein [Steroidobacteraceae bacterium]
MMQILQAVLGIVVFIAIALLFSSNVRRIDWKLVGIAIALQFVICVLLLKVPVLADGLQSVNGAVIALNHATVRGTAFVYDYLGGGPT